MAVSEQNITDIFISLQKNFSEELALREQIRDITKNIEQIAREIMTLFQVIHSENGSAQVPQLIKQSGKLLEEAAKGYVKLASIVPNDEYYKYHDHWRFVSQRLIFLISLTQFLESGHMASREIVASKLSVKVNRSEGFHVDLEDYLSGLLLLASELSRFAVNSVTSGDYQRPIQISQFVNELNSGFRLLNFKNDGLRKKFDGLKYDLKKIEEVVYDLSIRGLKPGPIETSANVDDQISNIKTESQISDTKNEDDQKMDM